MPTWEYLRMGIDHANANGPVYLLLPRQTNEVAQVGVQGKIGPDQEVALLDVLGHLGWELVAVDVQTPVFWLKRQVAEPAPEPVDVLTTIY